MKLKELLFDYGGMAMVISSVVLNGYPLKTSGNQIILQVEKNLSELWFSANTNNTYICVIRND